MFGNVTRTDVEAAERAVADGHRVDVERIALAREQGEPDPKPQTEPEARRELAGAEHELEIVQAQLTQVRAEYQRVAAEQHERWQTALENGGRSATSRWVVRSTRSPLPRPIGSRRGAPGAG